MFIQTEATPNPATLKFLPGLPVMARGAAEFKSADQAARSPLAKMLFTIDGVDSVFFGSDFVSVTKSDALDWALLKTHILGALMQHFMTGLPIIEESDAHGHATTADLNSKIVKQIIELLDTRVRPAVANDGGDITFVDFQDGVVYLQMRGACSGCPGPSMPRKSGIETMLKHYVPEVVRVEAVE